MQSDIDYLKRELSRLREQMIPQVGDTYLTFSETDPALRFGGQWEKIEDRFLLSSGSSYSLGTSGGAATHTLTIDEMPSHTHPTANGQKFQTMADIPGRAGGYNIADTGSGTYTNASNYGYGDIGRESLTGSSGSGAAHNNMPPYTVVHVWRRVA